MTPDGSVLVPQPVLVIGINQFLFQVFLLLVEIHVPYQEQNSNKLWRTVMYRQFMHIVVILMCPLCYFYLPFESFEALRISMWSMCVFELWSLCGF